MRNVKHINIYIYKCKIYRYIGSIRKRGTSASENGEKDERKVEYGRITAR